MTFGYDSQGLASWQEAGACSVQFWCVGPGCGAMVLLPIDKLIAAAGPDARFVDLARKARCRRCGHRGCHAQPADPPRAGAVNYDAWIQRELDRCHRFIAWARETLRD